MSDVLESSRFVAAIEVIYNSASRPPTFPISFNR